MENLESNQNTPDYLNAQKNWKEKGYLGVTAKDHEAIGSTPDDILFQNPDKTLGEMMTDEEIREYITGTQKNISENEALPHLKRYNDDLKQNLEATVKYLKSIGKLTEDFNLDNIVQ